MALLLLGHTHLLTLFLQVGKFMKCKWHGESDERDLSGSPLQGQNATSGFTTVSHSCQVFVTSVR